MHRQVLNVTADVLQVRRHGRSHVLAGLRLAEPSHLDTRARRAQFSAERAGHTALARREEARSSYADWELRRPRDQRLSKEEEALVAEKRETKSRTSSAAAIALSESEVAMIEALALLFNIAIGVREDAGRQVASAFDSRIRHWSKAAKPRTAAILGLMKQLATDPKMLTTRRQRAILRHALPKGQA